MKAILPAAGYATRMGVLTENQPKALLPISGRPIIEYIIDKISRLGEVDQVYVVTNNKFFKSFSEWQRGFKSTVPIKIINDGTESNEDRLGTIGDLSLVLESEKIDDDFLVINADNLFTFDLDEVHKYFRDKEGIVLGMYDVGSLEIARSKGNPKLDENMKLIDFKEKDPNVQSSLCSAGIYFFTRECAGLVRQYLKEGNPSDRSGDFIGWLYTQREVHGHVFDREKYNLFDIGSIPEYEAAQRIWDLESSVKK